MLCRSCDRACGRSGRERPTGTSARPGHGAAGAADPSAVVAWARRRRGINRRRDGCGCSAQTFRSDQCFRHGVPSRGTGGRSGVGVRISGDQRTGQRGGLRLLPKLAGQRSFTAPELGRGWSLFHRGVVVQQSCVVGPGKRDRSRTAPARSRSRRTAADRAASGRDLGGTRRFRHRRCSQPWWPS